MTVAGQCSGRQRGGEGQVSGGDAHFMQCVPALTVPMTVGTDPKIQIFPFH